MTTTLPLNAADAAIKVTNITAAMNGYITEYKARAGRLGMIADENSIPLNSEMDAFASISQKAQGAMRVIQILDTVDTRAIESRLKLALDSAIKEGNLGRIEVIWQAYVYFTTND